MSRPVAAWSRRSRSISMKDLAICAFTRGLGNDREHATSLRTSSLRREIIDGMSQVVLVYVSGKRIIMTFIEVEKRYKDVRSKV